MKSTFLLHHLIKLAAARTPQRDALSYLGGSLSYADLDGQINGFSGAVAALSSEKQARVAIFLEKRFEFVVACFGASASGCVFVPINPVLKPLQVAHILQDCSARILLTSQNRLNQLHEVLRGCQELRHIVIVDADKDSAPKSMAAFCHMHTWAEFNGLHKASVAPPERLIDTDMAAILYTSGSTGKPKGVVLSHRNMVCGAKSVADYLENTPEDTLLAALPLSFDAGFSQLTTAFHSGARVVLINYLLPRDILKAVVKEKVTGLTAVPPLWIQLTHLDWPSDVSDHLRYFANTGGRMPFEILEKLRAALPKTKPFLMYGLTEAFRSTYLPPEEIDRRPDSIGRAIPNAEILVLRENGTLCDDDEPGELVHRGALVGMGYWNDAEKTAERYRILPAHLRESGLTLPEIAVFSGDVVRRDHDGFLYFIGRRDEMIKTSGYRVSPTEVEEILYAAKFVDEAAAFGVDHPALGQAIVVVVKAQDGQTLESEQLLNFCRTNMPAYMVPAQIDLVLAPLPRNPNGKIDRKALSASYQETFTALGEDHGNHG
ncbi:acyl-CoA ligase (AMP-forming), exosortase A system-associated [Propionivibrio sp.]|uniref:acyl-CoA ligase (AMP-forming), exosortase A system-associated n=1 Tax=Propionivibrio sp. TaxID=2212460 RepID=UPI0026328F98|nr:acyl-CoA ligase (AMP-forming), exosortase A system-associated [Propionivibrio sp.]